MIKLFTDEEFDKATSTTLLPIKCLECGDIFYKTKHYIKSMILNPKQRPTGDYCSNKCSNNKKKRKIIKKICSKCNTEFETNVDRKYCSIRCSNSHEISEETKSKISISVKNSEKAKEANYKHGLSMIIKECDLFQKKCPICGIKMKLRPSEKNKIYCSKKCYNEDYKFEFRKMPSGGCRNGSGNSKSGWYKNYYCSSSYELAWVIYNIDHGIIFTRNLKGFDYLFMNETHKYYPDFIIDDVYYEIKGFKRNADDFKFKYFPHKLKVLFKKDLKYVFDYIISKYGDNFIELYEGNPHKEKKNICPICKNPAKNIYCSRKCAGIAVK